MRFFHLLIRACLTICLFIATPVARAGDLSKTLIAADIADHVSRLQQGMDLISEFSLSPNDVRKIATEIRGGAYEEFKTPSVKMLSPMVLELKFDSKVVKLSFKTLERDELRVQGKAINLKGSKTYANYGVEVDRALGRRSRKANEMTGVLAAIVADVGYRITNSSLRDYGGVKAISAASDEKTLAAETIGFYRAEHARCVRAQHDGEREVSEFCSDEKYHPECLAAQAAVDRGCESVIESYFVCKEKKVAWAGTWDNDEKKPVHFESKVPSKAVLGGAFAPCCEQQGCYRAVRHDLVDLYYRGPAGAAGDVAPTSLPAPSSSATTMPNRFVPTVRDRSGFSRK